MAKKSQRRFTRYEKDQAGCISGFVHMFDFRYGRTTRKLLSNRRHEYQHQSVTMTDANSNTRSEIPTNSDGKSQRIEDSDEEKMTAEKFIKASVKELLEEAILTDQDSLRRKKGLNRRNKTSKESIDFQVSDSEISHLITEQKSSKDIDLESIMEELLKIQRSNPSYKSIDAKSNKSYSLVEENLSAAIQLFMNEKIDRNKDKELFLKLVQDAQLEGELIAKAKQEQSESKRRSSFFRRRSKSRDSNLLTGNEKTQPNSRIVILKPAPVVVAPQKNDDKMLKKKEDKLQEGLGNESQFSFGNIKKKFKNAMGKERDQDSGTPKKIITVVNKKISEENSGWSSPNRNHFLTERFTRTSSSLKRRENETNLMNEAKKHLSEMVRNDDKKDDWMSKKIPQTLGKILSFPEYKKVQQKTSENVDEKAKSLEFDSAASNENSRENIVDQEKQSQAPEETQKEPEPANQEAKEELLYSEVNSILIAGDIDITITTQTCEGEISSQCLKMDSVEEDHSFSSPSVSQSSPVIKIEENPVDKTERPSPISVLELITYDDDISPPRPRYQTVEAVIQPLQMRLNDQEICIKTCLVDEESAFEYVEAVLLASDLNWNEYLLRWLSSDPPLDPSLYDEVELFSNRSCHDQKLLFDCTNESLQEVCEKYFGCSFGKNNVRPVPHRMDLINEVWEGVEPNLIRDPPPHSLEKLLKHDMAKSKTWTNMKIDKENIVLELKNYILDELVDDIVTEFII